MCLVCPLVADCGGPRVTAGAPKASAEFHGSQRYYRGRVVDFLVHLSPGCASPSTISLLAWPRHAERERLISLIGQLAVEGLLNVDHDQQVRLPE